MNQYKSEVDELKNKIDGISKKLNIEELKKEKDILEVEGLGAKGVAEIKRVLGEHGITLK
jgi:DNA-directed RNA polymerase alpha subunit